ncbi:hypothetical protein G6F57_021706 [Rhizopus arrhizus]|nr:hypothetical protein G6F57_021706 [Rhizopus arrhizus]
MHPASSPETVRWGTQFRLSRTPLEAPGSARPVLPSSSAPAPSDSIQRRNRDGSSLATARALACPPISTPCAAAWIADTPAAQMPCTDSVSIGCAASSPWLMFEKPGINASPPDEPLVNSDTADRSLSLRRRQSRIALAASWALVNTVAPSGSMA